MGCGASSDSCNSGRTYAVCANDDAIAAAFDARSAHADLPHDAFDRPATAAELEAWEVVDDMSSVASGGAAADEPSAMAMSMRMAKAALVARVSHGINGDANQFAADREPPMVVYRSVVVVDTWLRKQASTTLDSSNVTAVCQTNSFVVTSTAEIGVEPSPATSRAVDSGLVTANISFDAASLPSLNGRSPPAAITIPGDSRTFDESPSALPLGALWCRHPSGVVRPLTVDVLCQHDHLLQQS